MTQTRAERARQQHDRIAVAAHRLFLSHGYERTSYQDIARAAGVERPLVQYYFPKKDTLVLGLMDTLLRVSEDVALSHRTTDDVFVHLHVVAQIYFGFLLDPSVRPLTLDVVSSRRLTDDMILFDETWLLERLDSHADRWASFTDDMTMAIGGAYELCYRRLSRDEPLDARDLVTRLMLAFMSSAGEDPRAAVALLHAHLLPDAALHEAVGAVRDAFRARTTTAPG